MSNLLGYIKIQSRPLDAYDTEFTFKNSKTGKIKKIVLDESDLGVSPDLLIDLIKEISTLNKEGSYGN